ncbi:hypothetical protein [Aquimarina sp. 2201CG5-10]|uniref:hypothetical protein n=1 Tax=Aquimarina callyspongiae TaxID=3098150 RepID=UPI002AB588F1|nr:hypothetical protein [Aquimarina sp. 2201CG5-10]MDY8135172.1 hypothetical protein [Aquimarina sp. 2201CG5-10]
MENTVVQNKDVEAINNFKKDIQRWKDEDILRLANHFHKRQLNKSLGIQYRRVSEFELESKDVGRFNKVMANKISAFKVHLALKKENLEAYTFYPVFGILKKGAKEEEYFKLVPSEIEIPEDGEKQTEGDVVPGQFKEMIGRNWDNIDNHLVDDLFIAAAGITRVRVHHYYIGKEMISYIQKLGILNKIKLYPGVDMNKFQHKQMISFAPTIGFETIPNKKPLEALGLKGILEILPESNEVFVEYLRPCPPTCPGE